MAGTSVCDKAAVCLADLCSSCTAESHQQHLYQQRQRQQRQRREALSTLSSPHQHTAAVAVVCWLVACVEPAGGKQQWWRSPDKSTVHSSASSAQQAAAAQVIRQSGALRTDPALDLNHAPLMYAANCLQSANSGWLHVQGTSAVRPVLLPTDQGEC